MEDNGKGGGDANNAQDDEGEQVESEVLWKLLTNHGNHNHMFFDLSLLVSPDQAMEKAWLIRNILSY